ncbi:MULTISPECIES: hypothetical protein [Lactiplantibacillus]|uniref:Uncharacterized protein n=1 Tax=Lactiplantibacillus pentosus TaxID=1589 RepID=A0AAW8WC12_LACPE|nr:MULTISPECIES: hypothetical protein [Lactiplantibacillus]AUI77838.1 hypothetical protein BB562_03565 [Lactiplantibacillus pentosus]MBU7461607.1 hypothetical protein [Lactiplantibacillus pentosus]MBU7477676.1 hypothetical protein [Lactiplantibacillus pentosus]MBU7484275.1 hypothetical protein [Lactiplantibacillus sp. 30.2.29]MBU7487548.1 hypothetical protein [Lactiplantibacillus pentosus]
MSSQVISIITTLAIVTAFFDLVIMLVILILLQSIKPTCSIFNIKRKLITIMKYLREPLKHDHTARKHFILGLVTSYATIVCMFLQLSTVADNYPVSLAVLICVFCLLTWRFSRAIDLIRNYWEQPAHSHPEFELASEKIFWLRGLIFKSALVIGMILSILIAVGTIYFGI